MLIAGIGCAVLTVLVIIAVAFGKLSVIFVFPPAVFSIVLITSAFSLDTSKPQKKPVNKKKPSEEEYVSPFFIENDNKKNNVKRKK